MSNPDKMFINNSIQFCHNFYRDFLGETQPDFEFERGIGTVPPTRFNYVGVLVEDCCGYFGLVKHFALILIEERNVDDRTIWRVERYNDDRHILVTLCDTDPFVHTEPIDITISEVLKFLERERSNPYAPFGNNCVNFCHNFYTEYLHETQSYYGFENRMAKGLYLKRSAALIPTAIGMVVAPEITVPFVVGTSVTAFGASSSQGGTPSSSKKKLSSKRGTPSSSGGIIKEAEFKREMVTDEDDVTTVSSCSSEEEYFV